MLKSFFDCILCNLMEHYPLRMFQSQYFSQVMRDRFAFAIWVCGQVHFACFLCERCEFAYYFLFAVSHFVMGDKPIFNINCFLIDLGKSRTWPTEARTL